MRKTKGIDWSTGLGNYIYGVIVGALFVFLFGLYSSNEVSKNVQEKCYEILDRTNAVITNTEAFLDEYDAVMSDYRDLSAEYARLESTCVGTASAQIGEAYSETAEPLPYRVPVDIQEPLPLITE